MNEQVIGVKEFVGILNETLSFAYPLVIVEGEVSSFKVNQGKWVFFDLKDDEATLSCFMPVYQLKVPLEDGMKVRVSGTPKLTKWGKFSFTAKNVELAGEGELRRAFELLKQRLGDEGLFDESRKRPIPKVPASIGIIASEQSAAYADFLKILGSRWGGLRLTLADVQVQGAPAPDQIVGAIDYFNQLAEPVDVLVLIRGGGSLEDLQAFNTEAVARAVAASRTPIIVGVGHEVDVSLADFAADLRAATPTDAARLVVPDRKEISQIIAYQAGRLDRGWQSQYQAVGQTIERSLLQMEKVVQVPRERVERLELLLRRDVVRITEQLARQRDRIEALRRLLASFDPKATLARGYAIVTKGGKVVKSASQVSTGDSLMVQLADGNLDTKVTS
jgi:exodeoxyribonuclease VII large subunit